MNTELSMPKIMRGVTLEITITGQRRTKLRVWLGIKLMIFAAFVMGCQIDIELKS